MAAIRYEFIAVGADSVEAAFTKISIAAQRSERVVETSFRGTTIAARRAANDTQTAVQRAAERNVATEAAAVKAREREEKRAADVKIREHKRALDHVARIRERHFAYEQRQRERSEAAERRSQERLAAERRKSWGRLGAGVRGASATGIGVGGALFTGAMVAATRDEMRLQETSQRIAINARKAGQEGINAGQLRREFEATAIATPGVAAADVADAVQRFIALTGDIDTARRGQGVFATVASATGAKVGDVAEAAASISQQFDVKNLEDMKDALAALTFQGKEGAFELRDAAAQFQRLAASGGAFGIEKSVRGVKTLGGLTQIARTGTRSAEEAATAVENMLTQFKAKSAVLGRQGVDVFRSGKVRDIRELIVETISKVGGTDIAKKQAGLTTIFGGEGIRAINPLVSRYNEAFQQANGTADERQAAAQAAVTRELQKAIDAPGNWAEVLKDAATAQQGSSAKVTAAWAQIQAKVGEQVLPVLDRLLPKITESVDALEPFIEAVGLAGEGLVYMLQFLKDMNIVQTREKTHAEKADVAEKKLKQLDETRQIGPLTPEQAAARKRLVDEFARETSLGFEPSKQGTSRMSTDEFAKRYYELNAGREGEKARAMSLASTLARDPDDSMASNDWLQRFGGETPEQKELRNRFSEQVTSDKLAGKETEGLKSELVALQGAARAATRALAAMEASNRPHILQGG